MKLHILDEHRDQILRMVSENKSITEIYKAIGCSRSTLRKWLKNNNLCYKGNQCHRGEFLKEEEIIFAKNTHYAAGSFLKWILGHNVMEYQCKKCGISKWNGKEIRLEIDHINGDRSDNRKENLQFLCPNCHSQTSTFRGRNINKGVKQVTDKDLLAAIKSSPNIYNALIKVGLAPKGANYARAKKLIEGS